MGNFFVPSKQVYTPELYIPGNKPAGLVEPRSYSGLVRLFGLFEGGGTTIHDDARNASLSGSGSGWTWAKKEAISDGSSGFTSSNVPISNYPFSLLIIGSADFAVDTVELALAICLSTSNTEYIRLGGYNNNLFAQINSGGGGARTLFGDTTIVGGSPIKALFIAPSSDTSTWEIWLNGRRDDSGITGSVTFPSLDNIGLGIMDRLTPDISPGYYVGGAVFNMALTPGQAKAITTDPWNELYRPPGPEYLTFSTGGAIVLSIADLAHAHALDNVALTQAQVLAAADLSHAHTLDNVALTQAQVLAIAGALHAHGLDAVELATGTLLVITDLAHAHALDAANLIQAQVLAIADALHGHALDGVTLDLGEVTLVISDLIHAHLLDACNVYPLDSVDTPAGRVFLIEHESRIFAVAAESRIFNVQ